MNKSEFDKIVSEVFTPNVWRTIDSTQLRGFANKIIMGGESFDQGGTQSAFGTALERCIKNILISQFGDANVPTIVSGCGTENISADDLSKISLKKRKHQCAIFTRLPINEVKSDLKRILNINKNEKIRWNQDMLLQECDAILDKYITNIKDTDPIYGKAADIFLFRGNENCWYVIEVKTTGNCDADKTEITITDSMLLPLIFLGKRNKKVILGIASNNVGRTKKGNWKANFDKYMDESICLMEEKFGNFFLPPGISWDDFEDAIRKGMGPKP